MFGIKRRRRPRPLHLGEVQGIYGNWQGETLRLCLVGNMPGAPAALMTLPDRAITNLLVTLAEQPLPPGQERAPTGTRTDAGPDRSASEALMHTAICPACLNNWFVERLGDATPWNPQKLDSDMMRPMARAAIRAIRLEGADDEPLIEALSILYVVLALGFASGELRIGERE